MTRNKIGRWDEVYGAKESQKRMITFLENQNDSYALLQLRQDDDTDMELFASLKELKRMGKEPDIDHYEVVYTGNLVANLMDREHISQQLDVIYASFNRELPDDYTGHSLSVSDVIALKIRGEMSWHYVDTIGFQQLPDFINKENYLKYVEMSMEDDYGMIDGIINNGKKYEPEERSSVLEKLKSMEQEDVFSKFAASHEEPERS